MMAAAKAEAEAEEAGAAVAEAGVAPEAAEAPAGQTLRQHRLSQQLQWLQW